MKANSFKTPTIVRIAVCVVCVAAFIPAFNSFTLENPTSWGCCAIGLLVFLVTSATRRARFAFGVAAVCCFAIAANKLTYFLPLRQPVDSMEFVDTPLPDVLQAVSQQRRSKPYRRFVICDAKSLNKRLSIMIPRESTLGESLKQIANAAGCQFEWHWWSWCGNSYPPTTAKIYFFASGKTRTKGLWEFDRGRLWLRNENGILLTDPEGDPVASAAEKSFTTR